MKRGETFQIEARAHIRVQATIDSLHKMGRLPDPVSRDFLLYLHREFYEGASDEMLTLEDGSRLVPGELRTREVTVGRHIAPEAATVPRLINYFSNHYASEKLGLSKRVPKRLITPLIGPHPPHPRFPRSIYPSASDSHAKKQRACGFCSVSVDSSELIC